MGPILNKLKRKNWLWLKMLIGILVVVLGLAFWFYQGGYFSSEQFLLRQDIARLEKALADEPGNADLILELGINYYASGDLDKAFDTYSRVLDVNPDDYIAWNNLGNVYRDQFNYQAAREAYEKALELNPNYIPSYLNLVDLFATWPENEHGEDKKHEILPTLREALELNPENEMLTETMKIYARYMY